MNMNKVLVADTGPLTSNNTLPAAFKLVGAYTDIVAVPYGSDGNPVARAAEIAAISFLAGSIPIMGAVSPAFLEQDELFINANAGAATETGVIPFPLDLPNEENEYDELPYLIGTKDLPSLTAYVKTGTLVNVVGVRFYARHLTGVHMLGDTPVNFDDMPLGRHCRIGVVPDTVEGTGEREFTKLPYLNEANVGLLYLTQENASGTGTVSALKVEANLEEKQIIPYAVEKTLQRKKGRAPQANFYVCDQSLGNSATAYLPMGGKTSLGFTRNWSVDPAAATNVYVKTVHGIDAKKGY